jgi:hypothetical protein
MGLHIYSGSLVRFYTHDWENEIQRMARERGIEYQASWPGGEPKWPSKAEAAEHLAWMRQSIIEKQKLPATEALWDDAVDDYHTIKLHHEAREAITIVSAHLHRPDLPMPRTMPHEEFGDNAYNEASAKGYLIGPIAAFESALVLPGAFDGIMFVESPLKEQVLTCSKAFLRKALAFVREGYWGGSVSPHEWTERGLGFARGSGGERDGEWVADEEPEESLRLNAEFAFGVYSSMLDFSDSNRTAIATW